MLHRGDVELPTGVVTFLLTDIEGSATLWDESPVAMAPALERHDELVEKTVAAHGGQLLKHKGEGDSTLSVFAHADDAARATLALQRTLADERWPDGLDLRVRVAIHTGEAQERGGDYFGPTVNRAARVRGLAMGGQVLVSQATAVLVAECLPTGAALVDLGEFDLRGLSSSEHIFELVFAGSSAGGGGALEPSSQLGLPAPLVQPEGAFFVGRRAELDQLTDGWRAAAAGKRRCVLIGGEPGIGKTRLTAEVARLAGDDGGVVLFGRCDEDVGTSYQPFIEALRSWVVATPTTAVRQRLGRHLSHLARIVPELAAGDARSIASAAIAAEDDRYQLFEAVVAAIRAVTRSQPLLLVIDDVHWANKPTLLMLRHLLVADDSLPLLIVGTYRDTELDRAHPLADTMADLRRVPGVARLALTGLDESGVAGFVAAAAGHDLDERALELARALHAETHGNPFFISEVLAHLVETGVVYQDDAGRWTAPEGVSPDELGLPEGVREVVTRRLGRLSDVTNRALTVASVVGPTFSLPILAAVLDDVDVIATLDEALASGLVVETADGSFSFAHALVRQTLYDEMTGPRRMRLHRQVGEAIEANFPQDQNVDALAHHFAAAALDGQITKAADYALAAARSAIERCAPEEAERLARRGIDVIDMASPIDFARRADLFVALAEAINADDARPVALRAAADARAARSPERLALAASAYHQGITVGAPDPVGLALAEEALAHVDGVSAALRARLMARFAFFLFGAEGDTDAGAEMAAAALELAREIDDAAILAEALMAAADVLDGSPDVAARLALRDQIVGLAVRPDIAAYSVRMRGLDRLELGDRAGCDADVADFLASEFIDHSDYVSKQARALAALLDGRYNDAEAVIETVPEGGELNAANIYAVMLFALRRDQGRLAELRDVVVDFVAGTPDLRALRAVMALMLAELGEHDAAVEIIDDLAANRFVVLPRDMTYTTVLAVLSEASAIIGHVDHADVLYDLLLPYRGLTVLGGWGAMCLGAVDRFLGMLAALQGRFDDAEAHYEAALTFDAELQSPPLVARTQLWFARMLVSRAADIDRDNARRLAADALSSATALGMMAVAAEAADLIGRVGEI